MPLAAASWTESTPKARSTKFSMMARSASTKPNLSVSLPPICFSCGYASAEIVLISVMTFFRQLAGDRRANAGGIRSAEDADHP